VRKWRGLRAGPSALGGRGIHGQLIREAGIHAELEHPSNGQPPFPPVRKNALLVFTEGNELGSQRPVFLKLALVRS
jgi:hypothetical protein